MFRRGQSVTVTQVSHDDGSMNHVLGQTGTVTGHLDDTVIVKGLVPSQPDKSYGMFPEELKRA